MGSNGNSAVNSYCFEYIDRKYLRPGVYYMGSSSKKLEDKRMSKLTINVREQPGSQSYELNVILLTKTVNSLSREALFNIITENFNMMKRSAIFH